MSAAARVKRSLSTAGPSVYKTGVRIDSDFEKCLKIFVFLEKSTGNPQDVADKNMIPLTKKV